MNLEQDIIVEEGRKEPKYRQVSSRIEAMVRTDALVPGTRLPSEKALASQLGVTTVTVSRGLQELVRKGILIRRVGSGTFVANRDEYSMPQDVRRVGIVCHYPAEDDWYASSVASEVRQCLIGRKYEGISLTIGECDYVHLAETNQLSALVVIAPLLSFGSKLQQAVKAGLPLVVVGSMIPGVENNCYTLDDLSAGQKAVEYLAGLGHREIGMLAGHWDSPSAVDRLNGFREGMWKNGLPLNPNWVIGGERAEAFNLDDMLGQLEKMFQNDSRPTAIFAVGYFPALMVYKAAKKTGLRVPEDLSVLGVDDPMSAEHLSAALTTFKQPVDDIVDDAMDALMDIISRKSVELPAKFQAELVVRESCKAPANKE